LNAERADWRKVAGIRSSFVAPTSTSYAAALHLLKRLGGSPLIEAGAIKSVTAIFNARMAETFDNYIHTLEQRHRSDPTLFAKQDWLHSGDRVELRRWVVHEFGKLCQRYPWNDFNRQCSVVPVIHGTSASVGTKIIDTGFATLSELDAGFYGRGMYFTSDALYALPYFSSKPDPAILLCLAVPGNPYPVVEAKSEPNSFFGRPLKNGYQCNYVLTGKDGGPHQAKLAGGFYDEIVIEQESQIVPIFMVEFDPAKVAPLALEFQREISR